MRHCLSLLLLMVSVSGCTHYTNIERVQIGMTPEELMQIDTPCYYRGSQGEKTYYNCKFKVSSSEYMSSHAVKPYILTFTDNKLAEISLDEAELDRQQIRNWYYGPGYYGPGYYYPYGYPLYHFHGYGYHRWCP